MKRIAFHLFFINIIQISNSEAALHFSCPALNSPSSRSNILGFLGRAYPFSISVHVIWVWLSPTSPKAGRWLRSAQSVSFIPLREWWFRDGHTARQWGSTPELLLKLFRKRSFISSGQITLRKEPERSFPVDMTSLIGRTKQPRQKAFKSMEDKLHTWAQRAQQIFSASLLNMSESQGSPTFEERI